MGSRIGTIKVAAKSAGLSIEEYLRRKDAGLKLCSVCREWRLLDEFPKDSSRPDGREYRCRDCRVKKRGKGIADIPNKVERRRMRKRGLEWCNGCLDWLDASEVYYGYCRRHRNENYRRYYGGKLGERVRARVRWRKHNVLPIPGFAMVSLMELFDGKCAYCRCEAEGFDHIVPVSKGGETKPNNIVPVCKKCNASKKDRDIAKWLGYIPDKVAFVIELEDWYNRGKEGI